MVKVLEKFSTQKLSRLNEGIERRALEKQKKIVNKIFKIPYKLLFNISFPRYLQYINVEMIYL